MPPLTIAAHSLKSGAPQDDDWGRMRMRIGRAVCALSTVVLIACASAPVPALAAVAPGASDGVIERYARALGDANGSLSVVVRHALAERVLLLARYYDLDPRLLAALVSVESSWRPRAVSPVGALGFGQLMPSTAAALDVVALEPYENLDGTARYLRRLLNRYPGTDELTRVRLALASYNAGPAAVARYNGVPPYRETQAYVRNVVARWQRLGATLEGPTVLAAAALLERPAAVSPRHAARARRAHEPVRIAAAFHAAAFHATAKRAHRPRRLLAAVLPVSLPPVPPAPVRYETSHSVFARLLGLRHRVDVPALPANRLWPSLSPSAGETSGAAAHAAAPVQASNTRF